MFANIVLSVLSDVGSFSANTVRKGWFEWNFFRVVLLVLVHTLAILHG